VSFECMIKGSKKINELDEPSTSEAQPVAFKATEEKKEESTLGMAILPVGSDIRGYPTRWVRFRVQYFTHGFYPYPTRGNIGSGSDIVLYPRVPADIRKYVDRREVANCGPIAGPTCDRLG
jgi:hypothetical protein